jgi:lysine/ornithine N-monooxygenase
MLILFIRRQIMSFTSAKNRVLHVSAFMERCINAPCNTSSIPILGGFFSQNCVDMACNRSIDKTREQLSLLHRTARYQNEAWRAPDINFDE